MDKIAGAEPWKSIQQVPYIQRVTRLFGARVQICRQDSNYIGDNSSVTIDHNGALWSKVGGSTGAGGRRYVPVMSVSWSLLTGTAFDKTSARIGAMCAAIAILHVTAGFPLLADTEAVRKDCSESVPRGFQCAALPG